VYRRADGLTAGDRSAIERDRTELNRITGRYDNTTPFAEPDVSPDGTTALVRNQIRGTGEAEDIIDPVQDYRDAVSVEGRAPPGLQSRSEGRPASRPTPSRSSTASTARCCSRR
jgi:hypothetical protein